VAGGATGWLCVNGWRAAGHQSTLAALAMGTRFAVITVSEKTISAIENALLAYGLQHRAIQRPVCNIAPASEDDLLLGAVNDPSREFISPIEDVAADCIHDGAEKYLEAPWSTSPRAPATSKAPGGSTLTPPRAALNEARRALGLI
jgi:hypothetical protein